MKCKSRLKSSGITQDMISKWFGYSSPESFRNSKAKEDMIKGIEKVLSHYHQYILERIDDM